MVGTMKVGEHSEGFMENRVTSKFFRLEKECEDCVDVYEFNQVIRNGNKYVRHHEEILCSEGKRHLGYIFKDIKFRDKESGNRMYEKLKNDGYRLAGIFEEDILGYSRRIK